MDELLMFQCSHWTVSFSSSCTKQFLGELSVYTGACAAGKEDAGYPKHPVSVLDSFHAQIKACVILRRILGDSLSHCATLRQLAADPLALSRRARAERNWAHARSPARQEGAPTLSATARRVADRATYV